MNVTIGRLAVILFFCTTLALSADVKGADLIGTWKWSSVDGRPVHKPFYIKLSPNHAGASWPVPADWTGATNGVSKGAWSFQGDYFTIDTTQHQDAHKSRIKIKNDEMTLTTEDGVNLVYRRLTPDLEPGKLDPAVQQAVAAIKSSDIVGTWKLVSLGGAAPDQTTAYLRYYANGKAAAWPSADPQAGASGVSEGKWTFDNGYLIFASTDGKNSAKTWVVIGPKSMTLSTDDGYEQVYRRIGPDLKPGQTPH